MKSVKQGYAENTDSYTKSGAYAEQALNSIKVVSAFGQEYSETVAYASLLDESKRQDTYTNLKSALGFGVFCFILLC